MASEGDGSVFISSCLLFSSDGSKHHEQDRRQKQEQDHHPDASRQPAVHVSEHLLLRERTTGDYREERVKVGERTTESKE